MFLYIEIPKHWRLSVVRVRNVYYLFWLLVFQHEERETHTIFTMLTVPISFLSAQSQNLNSLTQQTRAHPVDHNWISQVRISTNCFFSKITKIPSPSLPGMTSFSLWCFYYDICDCHILRARAWTALSACAGAHIKPNSSKPNQTER